jgi:UDP-glucose-4-epimerase GalE
MSILSSASHVLVSGGAGYIGSHAAYALKQAGYVPVVVDNLVNGNAWAAQFGPLAEGDIGDVNFIRGVCEHYRPVAAMHFAAFIEVGESVQNPDKYFSNNRDKAKIFFSTLQESGVRNIVFSSTAAVYGEVTEPTPIREDHSTFPINPYGQSKLDAEEFLRSLDRGESGVRSATLRYFNVAGAAAAHVGIGEAHWPETHLIPRLIMPLIDAPADILKLVRLDTGFTVYGDDYPTRDGTAIRDYIHVMDLAAAHVLALDYLLKGGATYIFNLGSGAGFSVAEIVQAARQALNRPDFKPGSAPRRAGDPAVLIADSGRATRVLGWRPEHALQSIIASAAAWHAGKRYQDAMREKSGG